MNVSNQNEGKPNPGEEPVVAGPAELPEELARRKFFSRLSVVLGVGTAVAFATPMVGFILEPLVRKVPFAWRKVGKVDEFAVGETVAVRYEDSSAMPWAGVTARTAAWLRRESAEEFIAFSVHCTHLGCPVRWLPEADLFMCPCHGGVFYKDGAVAAGPPPRPLTRYPVRVHDGEVEIMEQPIPIA